jgi:hypothetical protein
MEEYLCIACGTEAIALCFKVCPEVLVIVDLSVEDDYEAFVVICHRLRPCV